MTFIHTKSHAIIVSPFVDLQSLSTHKTHVFYYLMGFKQHLMSSASKVIYLFIRMLCLIFYPIEI